MDNTIKLYLQRWTQLDIGGNLPVCDGDIAV